MYAVILGGRESGVGAALLAQKQGYDVFVSDASSIPAVYRSILLDQHIAFEQEGHSIDKISSADLVIKSPGIPCHAPIIGVLARYGMPIMGEIEFASQYVPGKVIAITGTNGKSTTAYLTYYLLKEQGANVALVGNIGYSLARSLVEEVCDYYVVELSSFQLEDITSFRPHIACLLNISHDHLNRYHHDMALYSQAKFNIIKNLTQTEYFIYNHDDPWIRHYLQDHTPVGQCLPISMAEETLSRGSIVEDQGQSYRIHWLGQSFCIKKCLIPIPGLHNHYNALVAITAALLAGVQSKVIEQALPKFQGLPHRIESCGAIHGVACYNDSKATNVDATRVSLSSFEQPIVWIAGGQDKGNDYSQLYAIVKEKVKAMVFLGRDNAKMMAFFSSLAIPMEETDNMRSALEHALRFACKGDIILLSPACASFDLFDNFEDRGEQFKRAIALLNQGPVP